MVRVSRIVLALDVVALWPLWLAFATAIAGFFGTYLATRNKRAIEERDAYKKQLEKKEKTCSRLTRDYIQALEFNMQDRFTIRELAMMVRDYRKQLNLPHADFLLELYERAQADVDAQRTDLQRSIHQTIDRLEE